MEIFSAKLLRGFPAANSCYYAATFETVCFTNHNGLLFLRSMLQTAGAIGGAASSLIRVPTEVCSYLYLILTNVAQV